MPTYDYLCENCGYRFEEFQSMTAEPLTFCPKCHGKIRRLMSAGNGFLFKGSGFYITDYRSENYKKAKQKETSSVNKSDKPKTEKTKSTKKSTARMISSGLPVRCMGIRFPIPLNSFSSIPIEGSINPGAIPFTRISGPSSLAAILVNSKSAFLESV